MNGVGFEVILKSLSDNRILEFCTPVIYGSLKASSFYKKKIGFQDVQFNAISSAKDLNSKKINFINVDDQDIKVSLGKPSKETGMLAYKALEQATKDLAANKTDVLITAPIDKETIQNDKFSFPGHTEYLASFSGDASPLMILNHGGLRVGIATGHIPVKDIANVLTIELVLKKIQLFHKSLTQDFGIVKPRLAVLGLNPHASDSGLIGDEEKEIIEPAIKKAMQERLLTFGPFPADGFFGSGSHQNFDGILAMYHDQGLVPYKTLSFNEGVNFTAGLPIVRTSPDHGTGYKIAGTNQAEEQSFRNAIYQACDVYQSRKLYKEISANPLENQNKAE